MRNPKCALNLRHDRLTRAKLRAAVLVRKSYPREVAFKKAKEEFEV